MRMMQQKLRQEERDLMWSSCKTAARTRSGHADWFSRALFPAVKDDDSDMDVSEDSDGEPD